jgi:hypothetical protein
MVLWEALLPCVQDVPGSSPDLETNCAKTRYSILQAFSAIARVVLQSDIISDIIITNFQILYNSLSAVILNNIYWTGLVWFRMWFTIMKACGPWS